MAAIKLDILWSSHFPDKFVTFGTDLRLYNLSISNSSKWDSTNPNCDEGRVPKLVSVNSDTPYLKCVSWCPKEDYDHLLAVGQANGRVVLTSFNPHQDPSNLIGKEFAPRHSRQCNALSWNLMDSSLLAAGLDKYRTDCSLLIWDIYKSSYAFVGDTEKRGNFDSNSNPSRAIYEYGNSETIHSLQWFNNHFKTLIAGCNQKSLKVIDIRETSRQPISASTKAVYGIGIDPFNINRLASYFENQVFIWDLRNFDKPIITLNDTGPVVKVSWCPTRSNLLCSLSKDSNHLKLFDIQQTGEGNDELEPSVVERRFPSYSHRPLVSFCWHPFHENNLLAVNFNNEIYSHTVCERITLNWSPSSTLLWTQNQKVVHYYDQIADSQNIFDDLSVKIRQRVLDGYGFELRKNSEITKNDVQLKNAWHCLYLTESLTQKLKNEGKVVHQKGVVCLGVHDIICKVDVEKEKNGSSDGLNALNGHKSDCLSQMWIGLPSHHIPLKIYKSSVRDRALLLCGWNIDKDGINFMLDRLEANDCYQRAAAIAVFNMNIVKAIQILQKGAQKISQDGSAPLTMVALALSGYTEDKISLWREMCEKLTPHLHDPYLRAMFAFLTSENEIYDVVLNEDGISIQDRVAFACIFLSDNKLHDYLNKVTQRLIDAGCLDGLLLTGLRKQGVELLQKYVDQTGDVQSAGLIILQGFPSEVSADSRVLNWIDSYRELLDRWRLWHHRAQFDVMWHKFDSKWNHAHQIYVICHHCHKTISPLMHFIGRGKYLNCFASGFNKAKVSVCINCHKSLPRCALCLVHMGSPAGTLAIKSSDLKITKDEIREKKLGVFGEWFTWCQTCRHGGHADHMDAWFNNHAECPVTSCNCKCMSLDPLNRVEAAGMTSNKAKNI